jgi:dipeptidyl aminopeptidase/acylaminoacyl peptidase
MTYYAITHPGEITLAAAVDADGATVSYSEYVIQKALFENSPSVDELERQYGGGTFWQNKSAWLEQAPGFNVDKVRTPTLFACNSKISNLYMLETLGAFRLNRRPFEYINFPDGAHQLQRPRQRQASLEASVDWMNFWLQGKENPRSDRAARNERWRQLRVRQRAIPPQ